MLAHKYAGLCVHEGAPARGENAGWTLQQAFDDTSFAVAERRFAMAREYFRDRAARCPFDFDISVHEWQVETRRDAPADRCLPGAHQADEDDGFRLGRGRYRGGRIGCGGEMVHHDDNDMEEKRDIFTRLP
ncbi:hypothetical protein NCH01_10470 [Neoasaia chiangmaiensis]|nr:hypothetical protein NCH01_10470 [Neoasaia chiangmaiensis]